MSELVGRKGQCVLHGDIIWIEAINPVDIPKDIQILMLDNLTDTHLHEVKIASDGKYVVFNVYRNDVYENTWFKTIPFLDFKDKPDEYFEDKFREEVNFINDRYGIGDSDHETALERGHIYDLMRSFAEHKNKKEEEYDMPQEIERKFLVHTDKLPPHKSSDTLYIDQGYVAIDGHTVVRVRLTQTSTQQSIYNTMHGINKKGYLTVKGANDGITRAEFEYEIPEAEATAMLGTMCDKVLSKTRTVFEYKNHKFELDRFQGENDGLIVVEVELKSEDEHIDLPDWVGKEVSDDPRYYNSNLITHPYYGWEEAEIDKIVAEMSLDEEDEIEYTKPKLKKRKKCADDIDIIEEEDPEDAKFFEGLDDDEDEDEDWSEESKETTQQHINPNQWILPFNKSEMAYIGITQNSDSFAHVYIDCKYEIPMGNHCGAFGAIRKHDIHKGVDLYAPVGTNVLAVESGCVVDIRQFTGEDIGFPWWNDTWAVSIEGSTGVVVYGEIEPVSYLNIGHIVKQGDTIGYVLQVLKKDKGRPMSMLHFALHNHGVLSNGRWEVGAPQPAGLIDPTNYLLRARIL